MRLFVKKKKATQDDNREWHMPDCPLRNRKITMIDNFRGRKIHELYRKYCPYCGTWLGDDK